MFSMMVYIQIKSESSFYSSGLYEMQYLGNQRWYQIVLMALYGSNLLKKGWLELFQTLLGLFSIGL